MNESRRRRDDRPDVFAIGEVVGHFRVVAERGRGATGRVLVARDERTGRTVALKVPARRAAADYGVLQREATSLARLAAARHPGIVRVLEAGRDEQGMPWYAMEHVAGADLDEVARLVWVDGGAGLAPDAATTTVPAPEPGDAGGDRLCSPRAGGEEARPPFAVDPARLDRRRAGAGHLPELLALARRLADGLAFLHGEGIVHGDLSPRNVLVQEDGRVVLVDFGTAVLLQAGAEWRDAPRAEARWLGTPGYIAPERLRGQLIDARADLYAFGCILYELVTSRRPFLSDDPRAVSEQHLSLAPLPPSGLVGDVPPELERLILHLLAKDPRDRALHADEVVQVLAGLGGQDLPPAPRPRALYRPSLVGRRRELAATEGWLHGVPAARGGLAFIVGASGIGKTRLLNHLTQAAAALGIRVLTGQAASGEALGPSGTRAASPPLEAFRPFLQWIADRCATPDEATATAALQTHLSVLWPLLGGPRVGDEEATAPAPSPELGRQRASDALLALLERCGAERSLLVCLDDVQWADELTRAFLTAPATTAALAGSRTLLVCALRDDPAGERLMEAAAPAAGAVLRLGPLPDAEVSELVKEILGTPLPPRPLTEALVRSAEGNPFFVAEYLRAIVAQGLLRPEGPRRWSLVEDTRQVAAPPQPALPGSLRDLLRFRLDGVSEQAAQILDLACILGREFESRWMTIAFGEAWHEDAVDELIRRQILEAHGPARYRFVQGKLREVREESMAPERRRALHRRAAECLAALEPAPDAPAPGSLDAIIGAHWASAGEAERALPFLERAMDQARRAYAVDRAIDLGRLAVEQASDVAARSPGGGAERLRAVTEALADLLAQAGSHHEACATYARAVAATPVGERLALARLHRKIGSSRWTMNDYHAADAALAAAEAHLGAPGAGSGEEEIKEWIEIQQNRFSARYFAGLAGAETERLLSTLLPVVERHGTPLQRAMFWLRMTSDAASRTGFGFSPTTVALARHGLAEWEGTTTTSIERAQAWFSLGFALLLGGRAHLAEATAALEAAVADAIQLGERVLESRTLAYLTIATRLGGDVDVTASRAEALQRLCETTEMTAYLGVAAACRAWCLWRRGDLEAASAQAAAARRWWSEPGHAFPFRWLANLVLIDLQRTGERTAGVAALLADLLRPDHQRLPEAFTATLRQAGAAAEGGDDVKLLAALDEVSAAARTLGLL